MAETLDTMKRFSKAIKVRFEISKAIIYSTIHFNRVNVSQTDNGDIKISQE